MTELDRRSFLKTTGGVAVGTAALGGPFAGFLAAPAAAKRRPSFGPQPDLIPTPDKADNVVRLALPEGFAYRSFQASSSSSPITLDDGSKLPGRHDGMAAFPARRLRDDDDDDRAYGRGSILVRNHEENGSSTTPSAFGMGVAPVYDPHAKGGTSTIHVTRNGVVMHSFASLGGTQMNCSGGPMPWGSWVTCEETVNGNDVGDDFTRTPRGGTDPGPLTFVQNARLTKRHGYIFEVPAYGEASAEPITQAGRFAHEAVAFDSRGGSLYLTEDNFAFPSGFYRYDPPVSPRRAGRLEDGGSLWMLKVKGQSNANLSGPFANGTTFDVEWVKIDEPDKDFGATAPGGTPNATNDQALVWVGAQGRADGAALFSRLEGAVYDHGWVFWTSTQGGLTTETAASDNVNGWGKGYGQIWALDIRSQRLHMLFESPGPDVLDFPDNVTTSRRGTLVICEDHDNGNFLRGLTRHGHLIDIASNASTSPDDEFAGSTFSRDGRTLYVNMQASTGRSFAIWGPWHKIGV